MRDLSKGYRVSGAASQDLDYPTQLGRPQRVLVLGAAGQGGLQPYAPEGWAASKVQAALSRLEGLALPDQDAPAIRAVIADWPEWKRKTHCLCPLGEDGRICEGLRYDPGLGLLFERPKQGVRRHLAGPEWA